MDKIQEMAGFVAVVECGSFVAAAATLKLSKTAVSRHVADLETRLGTRLLQRTTRRQSLTAEGQAFYARCKELLAGIDEAESEITSAGSEPAGLIRVNAPLTFGVQHLAPLWGRFLTQNPRVTLDVALNDRMVDLVEEGYDLAIRATGRPVASTLISRQLASARLVMCASPAYLKRHGTPVNLRALAAHRVITYTYGPSPNEWQLTNSQGSHSVRVNAYLSTNNGDTGRIAALDGLGIIMQPDFIVGEDLRAGTLVQVLPEFQGAAIGIHAVYPTRKFLPLKVRRLVDFLVEAFRDPPWMACERLRERRQS